MSDSNIDRFQSPLSYYSNNKNSRKMSHPRKYPWNPHFHNQNDDEIEEEINQNCDSTYKKTPLPLLIPPLHQNTFNAEDQFHPRHKEESNKYPRNNRPYQHLEKHLSHRMWSNTTYQDYFHKNHQQYFKIHLVCYNILAQELLDNNLFLYNNCLRNNLKWYRRKDRLLRELLRQDADIYCLQEMQNDHYENIFRPVLKEYGYESIYLKRTGDKSDGCCLFYKIKRLKLIDTKLVTFYQENIPVLDRDNCGLIALFQPLNPNATSDDIFCVATTHLLFSPKRGDIKLAQIQYFLAEIDRLATKDSHTNSYYPIILCGDFNSTPLSPLIQFILNGYIKYDTYRCIEISGQIPNSLMNNRFSYSLPSNELLPSSFVTFDCRLSTLNNKSNIQTHIHQQTSAILTHNKQFLSVYNLNDTLDVTTNSGDKPNLVDYIFYTQQNNDPYKLNLLSYFNLYQQNQMKYIHMPNHQFPSDHFLLSAKFVLKLHKKN